MGRYHCKVCCRSHELPPISNSRAAIDYALLTNIQQAVCQLADLEPGSAKRSTPVELVVSNSDFAEEHVFSRIIIPNVVPEKTSGFWSKIYRAYDVNQQHVIVKVYKQQENYTQRQVIDRFHRVFRTSIVLVSETLSSIELSGVM